MSPASEFADSVQPGDVLLFSTSYFRVAEVREPTHPLAPGVVVEGFWFDSKGNHWRPKRAVVHVHDGKIVPRILSRADVAACFPADAREGWTA